MLLIIKYKQCDNIIIMNVACMCVCDYHCAM